MRFLDDEALSSLDDPNCCDCSNLDLASCTVRAAATEIRSLRAALLEISEMHCGDQPAASYHSDEVWLRLHIGKMRAAALAALKAQ